MFWTPINKKPDPYTPHWFLIRYLVKEDYLFIGWDYYSDNSCRYFGSKALKNDYEVIAWWNSHDPVGMALPNNHEMAELIRQNNEMDSE